MPIGRHDQLVNAFIFQCSTATYLDCVQKELFGSNLPWPTQVKAGDYCCLHHYEVGTLFGLWQATCNGGKSLVPRAWGGRFPFQVRVKLCTADIIEIPKTVLDGALINPATGKLDEVLEPPRSEDLVQWVLRTSGEHDAK